MSQIFIVIFGRYHHLVENYSVSCLQGLLLCHYNVLRWPCVLSNIWMMVEAIGSL